MSLSLTFEVKASSNLVHGRAEIGNGCTDEEWRHLPVEEESLS
jgi:hypothetical protein